MLYYKAMSSTAGLLINENNIYGLVNPPPATTAYNPKSWQDPSSAAVRWDNFYDLSKNFYFLANGSSAALDTIQELADALGNDSSFATTVTNSIATKAALSGAAFTGDVSVATAKNLTVSGHNGTDKGLVLGTTLVTATGAELNYMDGVSSSVQNQLDNKIAISGGTFTGAVFVPAPTANLHAATKAYVDANAGSNITGAATTIESNDLTASRALVSNSSGKVAVSDVTLTELGYLDGVTSSVQDQLDGKQASSSKITAIAALATTDGGIIVGNGTTFVLETGATARTSLGVDAAGTDNSTPVTLATVTGNYLTLSGQEITAGTVPVALGGTGATTASAARTALGVAIGSDVQAYHANLADVAGLSKTADNFIVADGSNFTLKTPANARTSLGLGSLSTANSVSNDNWSGTDLAVANGGTGASDAAGARTNLGLVIGTNVEAHHDSLTSIAGLTTAANKMIYTTAADTYAVADLTAAGRALLDDADAAAQRTTLGLGTTSNVTFGSVTADVTGDLTGNADTATKIASITNSDIVQLTATQTLTNKSLTSPTITGTGAIAGTFTGDLTGDVTGNADTATKIASITNSDIVQLTATQTLTNKSLTSPTITGTGAIAGTFTGDLTGDVTGNADTASAAESGSALESAIAAKAPTANPTFTGVVTLPAITTSSAATSAATKSYVDSVASGLDTKESVRVATTAAGTLSSSFANGEAVDGVTLATGDRILIKNQASASENGVYVVAASGPPTRATDFDDDAEVTAGAFTFVEEGSTNANAGFVLATTGTITVGTTELSFTQFSSSASVTAGTGLTKTGSTLSVDADQSQITSVGTLSALTVGGNLTISDGANDVDIASHDGTNGLKLAGTLVTSTAAELNILDGVTATYEQLNILDGVTATTAELNILDGVSADKDDLNKLSGLGTTKAELTVLDGDTTATTSTLVDGDGIVINDGGTMKQCLASDLKTYVSGLTLTTAAQTNITSVGTLSSLVISDGATIGSSSDTDAITIAANGLCTFSAGISGALTGNVTGNVTGNADTATDLAGTKAANLVYAGPGSGANAAPTFRALVADDIPTLNQNTTGTAATVTAASQPNITSVGTLTTLTVDDVEIDGKVITMTGSTDDTAVLTVSENGALSITTTDTAAAAANITITADGTAELAGTTVTLNSSGGITLDADGGTITFSDNGVSLGTITSSGYSGNAATATSISGLQASVSELNILQGVTAVAAELNILDEATISTTELNILDGDTTAASVTLASGDGVVINDSGTMKHCLVSDFKTFVEDLTLTTASQTNITSVGTLTGLTVNGDVTISDGTNNFDIASHDGTNGLKLGGTLVTASALELNYMDGVSGNVQTQLDDKADLASPALTGTPTAPTASAATNSTQIATTAYVTTAITNTDIANATPNATANKIVKRDPSGNASFVNVTASVITTGTSGGVGADVSDLTTRVTALEDSVQAGVTAPDTSTSGVLGDMRIAADGSVYTLYILVAISGSTYTWKSVQLS